MTDDPNTLCIDLLGKEYRVACPPESRQDLERAAQLLNTRMAEIKGHGKLYGVERIAIMAALNLAHDFLHSTGGTLTVQNQLTKINAKLDSVLAEDQQMDLVD